jgi:hypothetical protein
LSALSPPAPLSPPTVTNFLEALCERVQQLAAQQTTPNATSVLFTSTSSCSNLGLGGTTNVAAALDFLCKQVSGITPASIRALALTGGTLSGPLTVDANITVSGGSMQISGDVNSSGGRIRDQKFRQAATSTTQITTNTTALANTLNPLSFSTVGTFSPVLIQFQMGGVNLSAQAATGTCGGTFQLLVDNAVVASTVETFVLNNSQSETRGVSLQFLHQFLPAGTHTATVQWALVAAPGNPIPLGATLNGSVSSSMRSVIAIEL